jgi:hypothetical protein
VLVTRRASRNLPDGSTETYDRLVYHNPAVDVMSCDVDARTDLFASQFLRHDGDVSDAEMLTWEEFRTLWDEGELTLVNERLLQRRRIERRERRRHDEEYARSRIQYLLPQLWAHLDEPIQSGPDLQPLGDGDWRLTVEDNQGNPFDVITHGRFFRFAEVANALREKNTLPNERRTTLNLYQRLQATIPQQDWQGVRDELQLPAIQDVESITNVTTLLDLQDTLASNWSWVRDYANLPDDLPPAGRPAECSGEVGAPPSTLRDSVTTDQRGGSCEHHAQGLFENHAYPLKWYATCVRNQGSRGTCVAFGITAAVEAEWAANMGEWVNLSEEYLYYTAKNEWWPSVWGDGLNTYATARNMRPVEILGMEYYPYVYPFEQTWVYNPSPSRNSDDEDKEYSRSCSGPTGDYGHQPCSNTNHQGRKVCVEVIGTRLCGYIADKDGDGGLTNNATAQIWDLMGSKDFSIQVAKMLLDLEHPLVVSLAVTPSFDGARGSGFVRYQGSDEDNRGGHALAVLGYIDNDEIGQSNADLDVRADELDPESAAYNGGGYLIVKNSWGACWKDAGYVYLPYSWLKRYAYGLITVGATATTGS